MIKARGSNGRSAVTFVLDPRVAAEQAWVCGEWDGWATDAHPMEAIGEGGFRVTVELAAGRTYRFRYLLDGERWENDWAADAYVPNGFGGDDSVVDLTALVDEVPAVTGASAKRSPTKSATVKSATVKSATVKSAAKKAAKAPAKATAKASDDAGASKPAKKSTKKST